MRSGGQNFPYSPLIPTIPGPGGAFYNNQYQQALADKAKQDAANQGQAPGFNPNVGSAFGSSQGDINAYNQYIQRNLMAPQNQQVTDVYGNTIDLSAGIQGVGPYQAQTELYQPLQSYKAITYNAPAAYQAFQYQMPTIAPLQNVQPVSDQVWNEAATGQREAINQQYADAAAQARQAAIQGRARPEQVAALMANLGVQQQGAQTAAQRALDIQRAQQNVGIAQTTQGLAAQQASQQAQLALQTQEQQAQQISQKYNLDIDAARYLVQQQAAERSTAMGLEQAQREAQAQEYQKAYQSKYGLAQDVAQTQAAQYGIENANRYAAANALLQGQQAQAQNAAQQATYYTNLSQDERNALQNQPYSTQPTNYQMPGQQNMSKAQTYNIGGNTNRYQMPGQTPASSGGAASSTGGGGYA